MIIILIVFISLIVTPITINEALPSIVYIKGKVIDKTSNSDFFSHNTTCLIDMDNGERYKSHIICEQKLALNDIVNMTIIDGRVEDINVIKEVHK
jgi:hypothetical protein